nr:hypothetical protein [Tanacetum cinerariifolium]GEW20280.1 hypothetical protein [Tanacetum cinerariifolium]
MLRKCHGHGLTKGAIIQIFFHGLDEPTQGILDGTAGGIFLYKSPNQAFQFIEDKVLFEHNWPIRSKNEHHRKSVSFADQTNNNNDNSRLIEKLKALAIKMDSQIISLNEELQDMRNKYNEIREGNTSKTTRTMTRQYVNIRKPIPSNMKKSITELNNDVRKDLKDFKRCVRSMRTILDKLYDRDDGKTTGVLPNKESKTINQEPQPQTDFKKLMTKFLDGQRVTNMFVKNNANDMIIKKKQNENNFQTKIKNMERKINEWSESQNVSSNQTDRTDPPPPPPQAQTKHMNAVFSGSEKSDDSPKIQTPPPIIVNNKSEKDRPIKTSKKGYHVFPKFALNIIKCSWKILVNSPYFALGIDGYAYLVFVRCLDRSICVIDWIGWVRLPSIVFIKADGYAYPSLCDPALILVLQLVGPLGMGRQFLSKGTLKKSLLPPSKEATKGGSSKAPTGSKTDHLKKKKDSCSTIESNPSQTSVSTLVVTKMHKENQQATGGLKSLGVTSEEIVDPQLSSGMSAFNLNKPIYSASFIIYSEFASGYDASANSTAEANLGKSAPSDFIPQQQGMNEETKNTSYDHLFAGTDLHVLADQTKSVSKGLKTVLSLSTSDKRASNIAKQIEEVEASSIIKLEDLAKLVQNVQPSFKDLDSPEDDPVIDVDDSDEDEEADKDRLHATSNIETEDALVPKSSSPMSSQIQELTNRILILQPQKLKLELKKNKAEVEAALFKAEPSFPNVEQLNELLIKSLQTKFSKILSTHDFSNSLPTELKDLPFKFNELTKEVKGLKKQVHELEIELLRDLK